jgi:hypothetical protein
MDYSQRIQTYFAKRTAIPAPLPTSDNRDSSTQDDSQEEIAINKVEKKILAESIFQPLRTAEALPKYTKRCPQLWPLRICNRFPNRTM